MMIHKTTQTSNEVALLQANLEANKVLVNYYIQGVHAGFPSPADDFKELALSLDERFLQDPQATFLVKVVGDSMEPTLHKGDILVVKANVALTDRDIVVVSVNQTDFIVKRFNKAKNLLVADNKKYRPIKLGTDDAVTCLGVVKHVIRDL